MELQLRAGCTVFPLGKLLNVAALVVNISENLKKHFKSFSAFLSSCLTVLFTLITTPKGHECEQKVLNAVNEQPSLTEICEIVMKLSRNVNLLIYHCNLILLSNNLCSSTRISSFFHVTQQDLFSCNHHENFSLKKPRVCAH